MHFEFSYKQKHLNVKINVLVITKSKLPIATVTRTALNWINIAWNGDRLRQKYPILQNCRERYLSFRRMDLKFQMSQNWYSKQIYGFSMGEFKSSLRKRLKNQIYCTSQCFLQSSVKRSVNQIPETFKVQVVRGRR